LIEIQEHVLKSEELLLEYSLGDSASFLFAVTPSSFHFFQLPRQELVEKQVQRILPLLRDFNLLGSDPTHFIPAARELSHTLLGLVAGEIAAAKRVIIAPHGILHYLPFEVLFQPNGERQATGPSFADLPFLVREIDVAYVPSVSALGRLRASHPAEGAPPPSRNLLLVGDPQPAAEGELSIFAQSVVGPAPSLLPYVNEEMKALQDLYPGTQSQVLAGPAATFANLRDTSQKGPYRFVHFAVHGIFNENRPQYSGLILGCGPDSEDDGFLTTSEVFSLDLDCEQVVLSACSSALGEQITGEGLVGLTRGFMYAGARSVVAALWDVSGAATADFMGDFYGLLAADQMGDRAHALAEVKRRFIREENTAQISGHTLSHPYFWAAFVLSGEGLRGPS
jgi:CHAT domain-containing protein